MPASEAEGAFCQAKRKSATVRTEAIEKNTRTREADQECLQLLAICFTSFGTGNSLFKRIYFFSNQHQTTASSLLVLIGGV